MSNGGAANSLPCHANPTDLPYGARHRSAGGPVGMPNGTFMGREPGRTFRVR